MIQCLPLYNSSRFPFPSRRLSTTIVKTVFLFIPDMQNVSVHLLSKIIKPRTILFVVMEEGHSYRFLPPPPVAPRPYRLLIILLMLENRAFHSTCLHLTLLASFVCEIKSGQEELGPCLPLGKGSYFQCLKNDLLFQGWQGWHQQQDIQL